MGGGHCSGIILPLIPVVTRMGFDRSDDVLMEVSQSSEKGYSG